MINANCGNNVLNGDDGCGEWVWDSDDTNDTNRVSSDGDGGLVVVSMR